MARMAHSGKRLASLQGATRRNESISAEIGELELRGTAPSGRGGHTLVPLSDGSLLLWGGCDLKPECDTGTYTFDTEREEWVAASTVGQAPQGRTGHAAWVDGTSNPSMWVFGGFIQEGEAKNFTAGVHVLNLENMQWGEASLQGAGPSPRYQMSMVGVNATHALVFGGSDDGQYFDELFWLDVDRLMWQQAMPTGDIPSARESHSATLHKPDSGKLGMIVYGGYHEDTCLSDTYVLDIETMEWRRVVATGGDARGGHVAVMMGNRMYVAGGCDETADECYQGVDFLLDGEWVTGSTARPIPSREWSGLAKVDRRAYIYGGCLPADRCVKEMWLMDFGDRLDTVQFTASSAMSITKAKKDSPVGSLQPSTPKPALQLVQQDEPAVEDVAEVAEVTPSVDEAPAASTNGTNNTNVTEVAVEPEIPKSRPGRAMMDELREVRRQLKIAEDVCGNMPGSGVTSNSTDVDDDGGELCDESLAMCEAGYEHCGYAGCQTMTRSGNKCQQWDCWKEAEGSPGECVHTGGHLASFADEWQTLQDNVGLGPHNFCRNPDGEETIWCYTTNATVRWELCDPAPPNTMMPSDHNRTGNVTETCPDGTVSVPLANLNLEMFKILMSGNDSLGILPHADATDETPLDENEVEPPPELDENGEPIEPEAVEPAAWLELEEDEWMDDEEDVISFVEVQNDILSDSFSRANGSSIGNVTVCFGKTGPVAILGNSNLTLADLFRAMEFNRTIESSSRRNGEFKPSPSPKPKPYNYTLENGMIIGQNPLRGKRRPLKDVANRMERRLRDLNCTSADSANRPECDVPFYNLTDHLNATQNWTKKGDDDDDELGNDLTAEVDGGDADACDPDDTECQASSSKAAGADEIVCEPDDTECLSRQAASSGAGTDVMCEPDDAECLAKQAADGNSTSLKKKKQKGEEEGGFFEGIVDLIDTHGPVILLALLCFFVAVIIMGAIMTSILAEKRKLQKLERSLRDAQLKQQDEVWIKSM